MFAMAVMIVLLLGQEQQVAPPVVKTARGLLPVNRTYFDLAANSGGAFYFWAPGEFATSRLQIPIDREAVVLSYGQMSAKKVFQIPVESGVRELTLFAGIQRKDLALLIRPDGTVVREGDPGVALQPFQHMLVATVSAPRAGSWHLELTGEGIYAVTAHVRPGESGSELIGFAFVRPGGRPGHEGMMPIDGAPAGGKPHRFRLDFTGTFKDARVELLSREGETLTTAAIERVGEDELSGECLVPLKPFRVAVRGTDARGVPFQRLESRMREPR